jgi:hypothetical protein
MARRGNEPRHHAAHPPSSVSPNLAINKSPNVAAAAPNVNPSLGTVGTTPLDTVNGRVYGGTGFASDPALRPVVARMGSDDECDDPLEEPNINGDCSDDLERSKKIS